MKSQVDKLLEKNRKLTHSEMMKVSSHMQRNEKDSDWIINTLSLEGYDVPFRFKRKKSYRNLKGARINLTYYASVENIAGFNMEVMNVVRIRMA
ncbi:hypothetical protein OAB56_02740 [Gammaproteobacteria bacterium]|jgi:hypothetical protein|nr:hypothetical protein [Gammaproteobacteria bacterium]|tara:strand:- start:4276 stop:4557 length:282 start_codon:yes stop_codon:yes gene_type:complete